MLTSDTFVGNEAPRTLGEGGAVHVGAGLELIVHNSTFAGNEGRFGGAIWADIGSQVSLVHTTMSGPTASVGDALFSLGTVDFESCLVDGECAGTGSRTSLGSNLESPGDTCGFSAETDRPNVGNAALGSLADHGGPTPTLVPRPDSPARDFAVCALLTDQRGAARPFDGGGGLRCDAGAVEADSPPPDWIFADGFESGDTEAWSLVLD